MSAAGVMRTERRGGAGARGQPSAYHLSMQAALGLLSSVLDAARLCYAINKQSHGTTSVRAGRNLGQDFAAEVAAENCYKDGSNLRGERLRRRQKQSRCRGTHTIASPLARPLTLRISTCAEF
jgi:hypothetical protein